MKISVSELQNLISYALSGYSDYCIETDDDWYWNVLYSDMFNLPDEPSLAVGSLKGDTEHLRLFFKENVPFGQSEISRLAAILKLLANHIETVDER